MLQQPTQYSYLETWGRQRSPVDYSPWGRRELVTAEQLSVCPASPLRSWLPSVGAAGVWAGLP